MVVVVVVVVVIVIVAVVVLVVSSLLNVAVAVVCLSIAYLFSSKDSESDAKTSSGTCAFVLSTCSLTALLNLKFLTLTTVKVRLPLDHEVW